VCTVFGRVGVSRERGYDEGHVWVDIHQPLDDNLGGRELGAAGVRREHCVLRDHLRYEGLGQ
jgi:hypothetical protein